jgi:hypothetical protein
MKFVARPYCWTMLAIGGCFWKKEVEGGRPLMLPRLVKWKVRGSYDLLSLDIGEAASGE